MKRKSAKTKSNLFKKKPKRVLGTLEGKAKVTFCKDFKMNEEQFLGLE